MLWCSNYGFRGSTGYSFSIILSVSHFKPGLRYVGGITGLMSSKKLSVPCISQPSVRPPLNDDITAIPLREIVYDIIPTEIVKLTSRGTKHFEL